MIPVGDNAPTFGRFPAITILLIVANVLAFLFELALGPARDAFIHAFGLTPVLFWQGLSTLQIKGVVVRLLASMFLHAGWLHLIGNMLYLGIFGDNVEDRLGHFRFLVFYLVSGVMAMLAHAYFMPASGVPVIGASGAIAGVLGAYLVLFPRARVLILIPLFLFFPVIEVPAILVLGFWFFEQLLNGTFSIAQQASGVAWWAHVGGFVAGVLLIWVFAKRRPRFSRLGGGAHWT